MNKHAYPGSRDIITRIFSDLNNAEIPYVVLRNYEGLPDIVGHDIDLLVSENHLDTFTQLFLSIINSKEWAVVQRQSRYGFVSFIIISPESIDGQTISLKWDLWAPITWMGIPWIDSKRILKGRKLYSDLFYIPSAGAESASLLLKDLIHGKCIKETYFERIRNFNSEDPHTFSSVLNNYFGSSLVNKLSEWVDAGEWQEIQDSAPFLKHLLFKKMFLKHPVQSCAGFLRFILGHISDYLKGRNRVFVCFIGPDGSGKSTISSLVLDAMQDIFDDRIYFHGHFGILPTLSDFLQSTKKQNKSEEKPITDKPTSLGKFPAAVMIVYYSLEYLLGFFFIKIHRRKYDLVVFDRYYYDYAIQPGPFTMDSLFLKALLIGIPKPDIIVFLKSPAVTIYNRKPELSIQEISRQINVCDRFVTTVHNPCIVDNTQPKELVVQLIRLKIIEILRNQIRERHAS